MVKRIEHPNGLIVYRNENGKLHREDGPAIISPFGRKEWYKNGERHREDGPAVIWPDGRKVWYKNGETHRENGPAIIRPDGTEIWYLNDVYHSFDEWIKKVNVTKEEKIELVLKYG